MEKETISMTVKDMGKLGISWKDYSEATDSDVYAMVEGKVDDSTYVNVPISLIKRT